MSGTKKILVKGVGRMNSTRLTRGLRCIKCDAKIESIYSYGWGHETVYDEECSKCNYKFTVKKEVHSDFYTGTLFHDEYVIYPIGGLARKRMYLTKNRALDALNEDHPDYRYLKENITEYVSSDLYADL